MRRREFILISGAGALAWPLAAHAQQAAKKWRIGFLGAASAGKYAKLVDALRAGLRDFGYVEGKNLTIEFRWAEGLLAAALVHCRRFAIDLAPISRLNDRCMR